MKTRKALYKYWSIYHFSVYKLISFFSRHFEWKQHCDWPSTTHSKLSIPFLSTKKIYQFKHQIKPVTLQPLVLGGIRKHLYQCFLNAEACCGTSQYTGFCPGFFLTCGEGFLTLLLFRAYRQRHSQIRQLYCQTFGMFYNKSFLPSGRFFQTRDTILLLATHFSCASVVTLFIPSITLFPNFPCTLVPPSCLAELQLAGFTQDTFGNHNPTIILTGTKDGMQFIGK